jgi:two-component system phosphate regulon sensor histidine kinase PhoR
MVIERLFLYLLFLAFGGFAFFFMPWSSRTLADMLLGMLTASVLLYAVDLWRGRKFRRWLKSDDLNQDAGLPGIWGDASDRIRRLLKTKESLRLASEDSLRQFLAAIQASPNGVLLLDQESRIQWCNQTAAKQLGIDPHLDSQQLIGNMLRNHLFSSYVNAKIFDQEIIIEGRLHRVDNPHKVGIQLFPYGDGRMLLLSRDVTSLEHAEVMRRDFVANVSHEIRTPLTVLLGFVETLQNLKLSVGEQDKYLTLMANQAERMKTLVDDLLTLSRLEGSPFPSLHEWHSVESILQRCKEDAKGLLSVLHPDGLTSHALVFHDDELAEDWEIAGSFSEINSAFSNLISNALRYTPAGGRVDVRCRYEGGVMVFSVEDTGPGIAPEHMPRLSERFYRIDRSRSRDTGGTGLGLAIVKHVMQRHGGSLLIESKLNQGSVFSLTIPAARVRHMTPALLVS